MENTKNNYLATDSISKLIRKFSIPAIISGLVGALYNIVDQIFIGQKVGVLGNAATNVAFPVVAMCTGIALLLGVGSSSIYNLRAGQKKYKEAYETIGNGLSLIVIISIIFAILISVFYNPILKFIGTTDVVMPYAVSYLRILALGIPFFIFFTAGSFMIRADGNPRFAMISTLTGAILNVILDPILIFTFDMGMEGAAIATIIGQIFSAIMVLYYFVKLKNMTLTKDDFKIKFSNFTRIAALGSSACFNQISVTAVQITLNNTLTYYGALSKYGSEIPLATVGIVTKLNILIISVVVGIAQGCQPIFGFNYGAKNYERVIDTLKKALKYILIFSTIAFLIFQIFPRQIISIFGNGDALYFEFATMYIRVFMFFTFLNGIQPLTGNFFTAIGMAQKGFLVSLTRQILFLIPLVIILPKYFGIEGALFAGPIADFAAIIVCTIMLVHQVKQLRKMALNKSK